MTLFRRRDLLAFAAASGALAACGRGAGADVLKVGSQRGGTKAMMLASGVLDGSPLRIEWAEFAAAQPLIEAIAAGAVDAGGVGNAPFLFAYQNGSPIRSVRTARYYPRNAATALLVPGGSLIRTPAELRGKRIATGRGSVGHLLLLRVLARAGIAPDAATISFLAPGDAKSAFSAGSIDAWSIWNPYVASAVLHDGARILVDGRSIAESYGFTAASETAIRDKRPLIQQFLRLQDRAQRWASTNVDAYARVLAKETGLPFDVARFTANRTLQDVPTTPALIREQQSVLDDFARGGAVTIRRPLDGAFDTRFEAG